MAYCADSAVGVVRALEGCVTGLPEVVEAIAAAKGLEEMAAVVMTMDDLAWVV